MKEIRTIETVGVIVAGKEQYLVYNGSASFSRVVLKNETLGESVSATFMTVGIDVEDLEQKIHKECRTAHKKRTKERNKKCPSDFLLVV